MLSLGDKAPTFTLPSSSGDDFTVGSGLSQNLVLFFYPKDDTPGCTKEAIEFTTFLDQFAEIDTQVVGVSKDSLAKHDKFICKHDLGIPLLSDTNGVVCEAYHAWVEKKMYGKTFMGIERCTFLIDQNGTIQGIWRKVKVSGHVDAVFAASKELHETV